MLPNPRHRRLEAALQSLPEALQVAYRTTHYWISAAPTRGIRVPTIGSGFRQAPYARVRQRHCAHLGAPSAPLLRRLGDRRLPAFVITAHNPRSVLLPPWRNRMRQRLLTVSLVRHPLPAARRPNASNCRQMGATAAWDLTMQWPVEFGCWLAGVQPDAVIRLARRWGQYAVLMVDRPTIRLLKTQP